VQLQHLRCLLADTGTCSSTAPDRRFQARVSSTAAIMWPAAPGQLHAALCTESATAHGARACPSPLTHTRTSQNGEAGAQRSTALGRDLLPGCSECGTGRLVAALYRRGVLRANTRWLEPGGTHSCPDLVYRPFACFGPCAENTPVAALLRAQPGTHATTAIGAQATLGSCAPHQPQVPAGTAPAP
jgi:hypothetical protein